MLMHRFPYLVLCTFLVACGARQGGPIGADDPWQRRPKDLLRKDESGGVKPLLELSGDTTGPFLATSGINQLLVAIFEDQHALYTQRFVSGKPEGIALRTEVAGAIGPLIVKSIGADAFLIVHKVHGEDDSLRAYVLAKGTLSQPYDVARGQSITWVDVLTTGIGATLLWSEPTGEQATLFSATLRDDTWSAPTPLVSGASAWQARTRDDKIALAWVMPPAGAVRKTTLNYQEWNSAGVASARQVVSKNLGVATEWVDMVINREGAQIAWFARKDAQPVVVLSTVSSSGAVSDPQTVDALHDGESPKTLENIAGTLAFTLDAGARTIVRPAFGKSRLEFAGHVSVTEHALLGNFCTGTTCAPSIVALPSFDAPRVIKSVAPDQMHWNLVCSGASCTYLTATTKTPSSLWVRRADMAARAEVPESAKPVVPATAPPAPEAGAFVSERSFPLTGAVTAMHAASVANSAIVGVLGQDGSLVLASGAQSATVLTRAKGDADFAIAPWSKDEGVTVAWVALDNNDEEVHVTKFDAKLKRVNEIRLTIAPGTARYPALVPVADGWIALWIDGRGGAQQVYAARFDRELKRVTRDEAIGAADQAPLSVVKNGATVYLAWQNEGAAVFARISANNAARVGSVESIAGKVLGAATVYLQEGVPTVAWSEASGTGSRVFTRALEGQAAPAVIAAIAKPAELVAWSTRGLVARVGARFGLLAKGQLAVLGGEYDGAAPLFLGEHAFFTRTQNSAPQLHVGRLP
jgi:hypothetical protein